MKSLIKSWVDKKLGKLSDKEIKSGAENLIEQTRGILSKFESDPSAYIKLLKSEIDLREKVGVATVELEYGAYKHLTTVASGSILIMIAFIKDIVMATALPLVGFVGVASMLASVFGGMLGMVALSRVNAYRMQTNLIDLEFRKYLTENHNPLDAIIQQRAQELFVSDFHKGRFLKSLGVANKIAYSGFMVGLLAISVFLIWNLL